MFLKYLCLLFQFITISLTLFLFLFIFILFLSGFISCTSSQGGLEWIVIKQTIQIEQLKYNLSSQVDQQDGDRPFNAKAMHCHHKLPRVHLSSFRRFGEAEDK